MNVSAPAHMSLLLSRAAQLGQKTMPQPIAAWLFEELRFSEADEKRRNELYEKAMSGTLSPAENAELDDFVEVADTLDLLKARAAADRLAQPAST
ncbi:MAG: hypothetical protein K1X78_14245 [Verrucomicrobiaceae bacterium]|nr:hypothetical protein [Verrucomicrobiaceae bacterium]